VARIIEGNDPKAFTIPGFEERPVIIEPICETGKIENIPNRLTIGTLLTHTNLQIET
jgi:hypothetical protein